MGGDPGDVAAVAAAVLNSAVAERLPPPIAFRDWPRASGVRAYLKRYASVELPDPCDGPTHILSDDWDDTDALIAGPDTLIRYHWWTTA